jgi:hypothetical protein
MARDSIISTPTPKPKKKRAEPAPLVSEASSSKDALPAPSSPKKRKKDRAAAPTVVPVDVVVAEVAADVKGKGRASSEFRTVRAAVRLALPPVHAMDASAGARELLDSLVMRFVLHICHFLRVLTKAWCE